MNSLQRLIDSFIQGFSNFAISTNPSSSRHGCNNAVPGPTEVLSNNKRIGECLAQSYASLGGSNLLEYRLKANKQQEQKTLSLGSSFPFKKEGGPPPFCEEWLRDMPLWAGERKVREGMERGKLGTCFLPGRRRFCRWAFKLGKHFTQGKGRSRKFWSSRSP